MALTKTQVSELYVSIFNRASEGEGNKYWQTNQSDMVATADVMLATDAAKTYFGTSLRTDQAFIEHIYKNTLNKTVTDDKAGIDYWVTQLATKSRGEVVVALINAAKLTENKGDAQDQFNNRIAVSDHMADTVAKAPADYATSTAFATSGTTGLLVTKDATTVTSADKAIDGMVPSVAGNNFVLTTTTDVITGTNGDDTIIGEFGTSPANTLNVSDQIDGGAGNDIIKLYGTYNAAQLPLTITNVETLDVLVAADANLDFSTMTKSSTGIETFVIENATALNGKTITTTANQSLSLATGGTSATTAGTVTWAASATDTTANLTLNGYQGIVGGTPSALTITGAATTTLNIASTGSTNKTGTFTGPTTTTSHVVTGDASLTYALAAADATALNSIDASANTAGVLVDASAGANKAGFTFTGGTGNDSIKVADNQMAVFTSASQLDGGAGTADKLGILDTALTTTEIAAINGVKGFEVLGLNAAITLDASSLTSIKHFSIDTTSLTQTINNIATGSIVDVTASAPTALTLATATGVTDTTINLGTTNTAGITVTTLTTTGITSIDMSSNATSGVNTITTLANADNSTITLTGNAGLTITNALAGTSVGTKIDASTLGGSLTVVGSAQNDILIGGASADSLTGGAGVDTLTGNGGVDTFVFSTSDLDTTAGAVTDIITDFTTGSDHISNTVVAAAGSSTNYVEATSTAADLATLLSAADSALNGTVMIYVGQVGSDSYVVTDNNGTGYTDVIKLDGVDLAHVAMSDMFA